MNLVEWHNRIDFWADKFKSPRYTKAQRDIALNAAIDAFIKDRYENLKRPGSYSFELTERIREELYPIIEDDYSLAIANKKAINPPSFMFHVVTYVTINGEDRLCKMKGYIDNDLSNNNFTKASDKDPIHRKTATGFTFESGQYVISSAKMTYLKTPKKVSWSNVNIPAGANVLTSGLNYYVVGANIFYLGVTYPPGSVFKAITTTFSGSGTVNVLNESELPEITHEEICKIASAMLTGTFEDYQKMQMMNSESMRS